MFIQLFSDNIPMFNPNGVPGLPVKNNHFCMVTCGSP